VAARNRRTTYVSVGTYASPVQQPISVRDRLPISCDAAIACEVPSIQFADGVEKRLAGNRFLTADRCRFASFCVPVDDL
jgi:hypothetical protein